MEPIGSVIRLQVQESSLKAGEKPRRRYDPAPIRAVPALTLRESGVVGWIEGDKRVADVHNREHPASKNREGENDISIGFTAHYAAMRAHFGGHLTDGIAGENILTAIDRMLTEEDLAAGIGIETEEGSIAMLERVIVAEPCVEFSRYALRYPPDAPSDRAVTEALNFLRRGTRGFYATYCGQPARIRIGAQVFLCKNKGGR